MIHTPHRDVDYLYGLKSTIAIRCHDTRSQDTRSQILKARYSKPDTRSHDTRKHGLRVFHFGSLGEILTPTTPWVGFRSETYVFARSEGIGRSARKCRITLCLSCRTSPPI